jgi:hypothetical protein
MSDLVKRLRDGEFSAEDVWATADRIEALEAALRQARTVLVETALDSIRQEANEHREAMALYRPARQKMLDDEVAQTEAAIAAINDLLKD